MLIKKIWKRKASAIFLAFLFCIILSFVIALLKPYSPALPVQHIFIKRGENFDTIMHKITASRLVKYPYLLKSILYVTNNPGNVHFGEYVFPPSSNLLKIVTNLLHKPCVSHSITFREGITSLAILNQLNKNPYFFKDWKIPPPQEGSLFPSTYRYTYGMRISQIIAVMQKKMNTTIEALEKDPSRLSLSRQDWIVLASIIQGESATNSPREMELISSVFFNRLKKGQRLQSDLSKETYKKKGIPQEALNNPGYDALWAAVHPRHTEFLYFYFDKQRGMIFNKNYRDHQSTYRKINKKANLKNQNNTLIFPITNVAQSH